MSVKQENQIIAWAGWQLGVPCSWRPLRIEGEWADGSMIVGNADEPTMQVRWRRPEGRFDKEKWRKKRLSSLGGHRTRNDPEPSGFTVSVRVPEYRTADGGEGVLWFGYSPAARMIVEIVAGGDTCEDAVRIVADDVIPSLETFAAGGVTRWSIFGARFETPAGFVMTGKKILLGDIAIELSSKDGCRLVLRQVYPSTLALARRKLPVWMEYQPFTEYRRFRACERERDWSVARGGRTLPGVRRAGRKRFPFPLGVFAPRWSAAAAVCDEELDRLLIAEYDSKEKSGGEVLSKAIRRMNWVQDER